ncbi:hypothetical protein [Ottowia thiooxydans]|uniref:Uncharacterized protein n=1 Tax=Ottowia thiooxydans TaxID=219182 RepID=A0ABV2Q6J9_9BURK
MFDDIHAYFHENVRAAYREFKERLTEPRAGRSTDLRLAVGACEALFHLREHLPVAHALSRAEAEARCPDLALVGDIANVSKHRNVTRPTPHGTPLVTSATQLQEIMSMIDYEDAEGEYQCLSKRVVAELSDGTPVDVMQALTSVLNFWETYLADIGVLEAATVHTYDDGLGFRPRPPQAVGPTFEIVRGVRFRQSLEFMKFNPDTGRAEAINFPAGTKARMQIRKRPRHQVDLTVRHDASGRESTRTITLTEDESAELDAAPEENYEDMLRGFESMRNGFRELAAEVSCDSNAEI